MCWHERIASLTGLADEETDVCSPNPKGPCHAMMRPAYPAAAPARSSTAGPCWSSSGVAPQRAAGQLDGVITAALSRSSRTRRRSGRGRPVHHVVVDRQSEIQYVPIATWLSTMRGRWVIPPTMTSRDIKVRDVMPSPPFTNMPTAVTATVPMRCRAVTDWPSRHTLPEPCPDPGRGLRGSFQPPAAAARRWLALTRQLGREPGHLRMSASRRRWGMAKGPCGVEISTIVPTST